MGFSTKLRFVTSENKTHQYYVTTIIKHSVGGGGGSSGVVVVLVVAVMTAGRWQRCTIFTRI
jgi:hypothetical protein